ncbi:MAG: HEAT repeat domain-containing protein [Planctomycetes bacterium]|nr:HEAT repeat domain-containing protein [Planctomycetota bacterium]
MRIAAIGASMLLLLASCSTTEMKSESPFLQPNSLMGDEISRRVEQIPYQHRDELLQNLMWLAQTGEQTIPALLQGLNHENPKVRSSCAWVLGRVRDRRTIPNLQNAMQDGEATVRMECARTLVTMGDLKWSPTLIEGLDSDRKEVRFMCHEALKTATGHDFGYDHLNQNTADLHGSVLRWRQWWSEYSGDAMFAQSYMEQHKLQPAVAAPNGETQPQTGGTEGQVRNPNQNEDPNQNGNQPQTQTPNQEPGTGNQGSGEQRPNGG